jgi:phytoene dehydrogenase-like protein
MKYDAIVLGAGTNGLVAAHMLARARRHVLVVEQQTEGANLTDLGWVHPRIIADLDLLQHGLVIQEPDPWCVVPLPDGTSLNLHRDMERTVEQIRRLCPSDATRWPEFSARMRRMAGVLEDLYVQPAPDVETTRPGELLNLALLGLKVRGLGREAMIDLLRIMPMPVAELLDEWFEHDALKAALGAIAVLHLRQGPRSGGTAFTMLHHCVGSPAGVFHPPVTNLGWALLNRRPGTGDRGPNVEIRRGGIVERIVVEGGRAVAITLKDGERIDADVVVSSATPQRTLLELLEPGWLDPEFARAVGNIKSRGVTGRVTFHLSRSASFPNTLVAPSLDFIEHAYDDAKYGRTSAHPYFEAHSEGDTIVAFVQYVPYADGDWSAERRRTFVDAIRLRLERAIPAVAGTITSADLETPRDREEMYGMTGGHPYQGDHTLDQILFMRPVPGWSRYRTPVEGLFLCGAGTHPGGSIAGGAGWLAAREILGRRGAGGGRG